MRFTKRTFGRAVTTVVVAGSLSAIGNGGAIWANGSPSAQRSTDQVTTYLAAQIRSDNHALVENVSLYNSIPVSQVLESPTSIASNTVSGLLSGSENENAPNNDVQNALTAELRNHGLNDASNDANSHQNSVFKWIGGGLGVLFVVSMTAGIIDDFKKRKQRRQDPNYGTSGY